MWEDPVVADIHRTREMLDANYGFDVQAIFADLRKRQVALGGRLVSPENRAQTSTEVNRGRDSGSPGSMSAETASAT
jgi:hypothetical protein